MSGNRDCPTCSRPITPETAVTIGTVVRVRYCSESCRDRWIANGHDRRRQSVRVPFERRVAS
jgi:predicted nucleic acid-binding Zn ribbon protein